MPSPDDIILDEPIRFTQKLEFTKIEKSKNPQNEFLKQMEKKWNQKAGLQLWRHFVDKYNLINAVYKSKYKKDLNRDAVSSYFGNFKKKSMKYQKKIETTIKNKRERGYKISPHKYSDLQRSFINSKKDMPLYWLATEFNRNFKTKLTRNAIRDKRLRILGKKK